LLTFVVVGGGPTGVELAGAIAELAFSILKEDFRNIDTHETQVLLLEGMDRVLPPFAPELSVKAEESLQQLGVTVVTKTLVTGIEGDIVTIKQGDEIKQFGAKTVLWAAGVKASVLGKVIAEKTGAECDRAGRVIVEPDLSLKGYPNIYVIGDLAHFAHQTGKPLPGVAPVAMQQGEYVAKLIKQQLKGNILPAFNYVDKGSLAVIGQHSAVVDLGFMKLTGFIAWLFWLLVHIYYLVEFDNKLVVMIQWVWNYFTSNRGARLITEKDLPSPVEINSKVDYYPSVNDNKAVNV
jgi:NADH dehydrogenase